MHAYSIVTPLSEKVMSLSGFPVFLSNFISAFPFYYSLMENLATRDPVWRENGTQFVTSVSKLLERLLDYRTVIQVRTAFDLLKLLKFCEALSVDRNLDEETNFSFSGFY